MEGYDACSWTLRDFHTGRALFYHRTFAHAACLFACTPFMLPNLLLNSFRFLLNHYYLRKSLLLSLITTPARVGQIPQYAFMQHVLLLLVFSTTVTFHRFCDYLINSVFLLPALPNTVPTSHVVI